MRMALCLNSPLRTAVFVCPISAVFLFLTASALIAAGVSDDEVLVAMARTRATPKIFARTRELSSYFATNRCTDETAMEGEARRDKVPSFNSLINDRLCPGLRLGTVVVSVPARRPRGAQVYQSGPGLQNSLLNPMIQRLFFQDDRQSYLDEIRYLAAADGGLNTFVHGLSNTFSDAAERVTQLSFDTGRDRKFAFFSWPSDNATVFGFPAYDSAQENLGKSIEPLASFLSTLEAASPSKLVAHSMGADLTVSALLSAAYVSPDATADRPLALVAPDIDSSKFVAQASALRSKHFSPTVYCGTDYALAFAVLYRSERHERLGHCQVGVLPIDGVRLVQLRGFIEDYARHSYYLTSTKVLDDIGRVLDGGKLDGYGSVIEMQLP